MAGITRMANSPTPVAAGMRRGIASASTRMTAMPNTAQITMTIPTLGATGAVSARTVSLARRISWFSSGKVAPLGMNPRMADPRKNVSVRMAPRDRKPPAVTSRGWTRKARSAARVKLTSSTVISTGQYQPQPRNTPFRERAAPPTPAAVAAAIAQGNAPTRDLAADASVAGEAGGPVRPVRPGAKVIAPPPPHGPLEDGHAVAERDRPSPLNWHCFGALNSYEWQHVLHN